MKKRKILTRGIATALVVVSVFFVSHYSKAGENYIKTGEKVVLRSFMTQKSLVQTILK